MMVDNKYCLDWPIVWEVGCSRIPGLTSGSQVSIYVVVSRLACQVPCSSPSRTENPPSGSNKKR